MNWTSPIANSVPVNYPSTVGIQFLNYFYLTSVRRNVLRARFGRWSRWIAARGREWHFNKHRGDFKEISDFGVRFGVDPPLIRYFLFTRTKYELVPPIHPPEVNISHQLPQQSWNDPFKKQIKIFLLFFKNFKKKPKSASRVIISDTNFVSHCPFTFNVPLPSQLCLGTPVIQQRRSRLLTQKNIWTKTTCVTWSGIVPIR